MQRASGHTRPSSKKRPSTFRHAYATKSPSRNELFDHLLQEVGRTVPLVCAKYVEKRVQPAPEAWKHGSSGHDRTKVWSKRFYPQQEVAFVHHLLSVLIAVIQNTSSDRGQQIPQEYPSLCPPQGKKI